MIMNKKVSTIFAMAALMGGSLFSSAYAEKLGAFVDTETPVEKVSGNYFLKIGDGYLKSYLNDDEDGVEYTLVTDLEDEDAISKETLNQYLWTVSQTTGLAGNKACYTFRNVETQQLIRFAVEEKEGVYSYDLIQALAKDNDPFYETAFELDGGATYKDTKDSKGHTFSLQAEPAKADYLVFGENGLDISKTEGATITLQSLKPGIDVDEEALNKLYNSAGFNFTLNDSKLAGITNIFGDKKVLAIHVAGAKKEVNGVKYEFPEGTYFATATTRALKDYEVENGVTDYDFLVSCTFIAIDSDENILEDADQQKAGNGFTLTEVKGSDLVTYSGTWNAEDSEYETIESNKASGNQIAVSNACFDVLESTTSDNVFALSVAKARYKEASNADKQVETRVYITAGAKISEIYTQASTTANDFIFRFSESSAVKPSALLFKGDTAAIYNIQLYVANGSDTSRNGKYLTTTAGDENGAAFIAKGAVLADTDAPAYQWVISAVDGSDITFTNRENGKTLTTQLFDEGNGVYSLSSKGTESYTYVNVTEAGDVVEYDSNNDGTPNEYYFNFTTKIKLIPSKAVNYANYGSSDISSDAAIMQCI